MLYLLRSYTKDGSLLKVGYAKIFENRYLQYESHNPGIEKVSKKEGDIVDETITHLYLHFLGYGAYKDEWYKDCQEVIDAFNTPSSEIEKIVWEERENIFTYEDFVDESKKSGKIYSKLYNKHKKDLFEYKSMSRGVVQNFIGKNIDLKYISLLEGRNLSSLLERIKCSDSVSDSERLLCSIMNFSTFPEQMKYIYELGEDSSKLLDEVFEYLPFYYGNFYRSVSPEEAKRLSYRKGELGKRYDRSYNNQQVDLDEIRNRIQEEFIVGVKYPSSDIKERLGKIYIDLGYSKTPKANDLEEYFELRDCQVANKETGKRDRAYEIIKKKN